MDENLEKKPKRPRIGGEARPVMDDNESARNFESTDFNREAQDGENAGADYQGGYQQRTYNRPQQGYQQRGYNRPQQGGYQQRNYQGGYQ